MSTTRMARRLVEAVAARDHDAIVGTLAPDVRFRYLIPPGPGGVVGAANAAATYLDWFGSADPLEVKDLIVGQVADRVSARYRFRARRDERWEVIEQQTYLDVDAVGRITTIDLVCSGFRPAADPEGGSPLETHEFDAGTMGCSDGLAPEFRRRIAAIPIGDVLVVAARDPAAKEDLPPLARMMGHTIRSIETPGDGRLIITVERGR
jgi:TusA-related sulfurtransferase